MKAIVPEDERRLSTEQELNYSPTAVAISGQASRPHSANPTDIITSDVGGESGIVNAAAKQPATHTPCMTHVLVRLGRLFGVYYIPERLRNTILLGELVLVEAAHGTNTGIVITDYSAQVAEIKRNYADHPFLGPLVRSEGENGAKRERLLNDVLYPEDCLVTPTGPVTAVTLGSPASSIDASPHDVTSPTVLPPPSTTLLGAAKATEGDPTTTTQCPRFELYSKAAVCGLPEYDTSMQRLPRILRRGVNKDKKKVYFSRKRDVEALQLINKTIYERNWSGALSVANVGYQVDFLSLTVFPSTDTDVYARRSMGGLPKDDRDPPRWSAEDYASVGTLLSSPLRTDIVEFRHVQQYPELAHLTRHIMGDACGSRCEADLQEHDRAHLAQRSSISTSGTVIGSSTNDHSTSAGLWPNPTVSTRSSLSQPVPLQQPQTPIHRFSAVPQGAAPQPPQILFTSTDNGALTSSSPLRSHQVHPPPPLQAFMPAVLSPVPGAFHQEASLTATSLTSFSHAQSQSQHPYYQQRQQQQQQQQQTFLAQHSSVYASPPQPPSQPPRPPSPQFRLASFTTVGNAPSFAPATTTRPVAVPAGALYDHTQAHTAQLYSLTSSGNPVPVMAQAAQPLPPSPAGARHAPLPPPHATQTYVYMQNQPDQPSNNASISVNQSGSIHSGSGSGRGSLVQVGVPFSVPPAAQPAPSQSPQHGHPQSFIAQHSQQPPPQIYYVMPTSQPPPASTVVTGGASAVPAFTAPPQTVLAHTQQQQQHQQQQQQQQRNTNQQPYQTIHVFRHY